MERWRLLHTRDGEPGFNMALDEALLFFGGSVPCLRLYTWKPAALSLGWFQRFDEVPAARTSGAVVRRSTGGGAIHHANELTFSIACDADHALYRGAVRGSYERVHAILAEALRAFGVDPAPRGSRALASDRDGTGMCFHHSTDVDLAWNGAKGVGSAQRRRKAPDGTARVLHHGSIKLGETDLDSGVATVAGARVEDVARAVVESFARRVPCAPTPDEPTENELAWAGEHAAHYTSRELVRRR